jgi:hypothetical protein
MGFFKNIGRQISIKNISPVAKVVSIVKKPVQQVISTGNVGFKDVLAVSPVGIAVGLAKQGTSQIKDVAMGNQPIPEETIDETVVDDTVDETTNGKDETKNTDKVPEKEKSKLPLYIGIGVGILVLGGAIFYFVKRKK